MELALNLSMDIVPPVHIATYCATCEFTVGDTFASFVPGTTSDQLRAYATCMEDVILFYIDAEDPDSIDVMHTYTACDATISCSYYFIMYYFM